MKKVIALLLCLLVILFAIPVTASETGSTVLRFHADGTFKILVLADCQDDISPDDDMMSAINQLLNLNQPDLVILTGDNVVEDKISDFTQGLTKLLEPIVSRNIPYAFTFGNHDDEYGVSKEQQYSVYKTLGNCLTTDDTPSLTGLGTCNIPILYSDNDGMAFNIWIVDSNTYDKTNGGYDHVHEDQLNWLIQKQNEITASEGRIVNSMIFQHIIVPEITQCLEQSSSGSWTYNGTKYALSFNSKGSGTILEHPCPPTVNSGEYSVAVSMGGVLGIVSGHDHNNNFIAKPDDVDLIQLGGMSYNSYGDERVRGASLITLNENSTDTYSIQRFTNEKLFAGDYGYVEKEPIYTQLLSDKTYISEVAIGNSSSSEADAKSDLTNRGFTVINFDLNKGAGGDWIYLGYKTTTDVNEAITSLRVTNTSQGGYSNTKVYCGVTYNLASNIDLNKGISGSNYIYLYYSKQAKAGAPITALTVTETANVSDYTAVASFAGDSPSDLNKKAKGAYIYFQTQSSLPLLNAGSFLEAFESASAADTTNKEPEKVSALNTAIANAQQIYNELKENYRTASSQSELDEKSLALTQAVSNLNLSHVHTPVPIPAITATNCITEGFTEGTRCSVCEAVLTAPVSTGFGAHATQTVNQKAATCKEDGYTGDEVCTLCTKTVTTGEIIGKGTIAHTPVPIPAITAINCITEGFTEGTRCSVCEAVLTAPVSTGFGAHATQTVNQKAATCKEDGYTGDEVCTLCTKTVTTGEIIGKGTIAHTPVPIPAITATNCITEGFTEGTRCSVCEAVLTAPVSTGFGAHATQTVNQKAATCKEDGYTGDEVCTLCTKTVTMGEIIGKGTIAHTPIPIPAITAINCITEGFTEGTRCSVCEAVLTAPVSTGFGAHATQTVNQKAATCKEDGYTGDEVCTLCTKTITTGEVIGKGTIAHTPVPIPAITAINCITEGFTEGLECSVCGIILAEPVSMGYGKHSPTTLKGYPATCTVPGKTDGSICSVCNTVLSERKTNPVIPHSPSVPVMENVRIGTCTVKGTADTVIYCTVCKTELSRTTESTTFGTHSPGEAVQVNVVAPTCTSEGYYDEVIYCSECHIEISKNAKYTDKTAHTDSNRDGLCDDCGYNISANCSHLCHKTGLSGIFWRIINCINKLFKINKTCECGVAHW